MIAKAKERKEKRVLHVHRVGVWEYVNVIPALGFS
jgi:hypothetical protein